MGRKNEPPAEYLTTGQAAKMLHVSPKTISRWTSNGDIPCLTTLGGHRRYRRADVEAIASQMAGGTGETTAE